MDPFEIPSQNTYTRKTGHSESQGHVQHVTTDVIVMVHGTLQSISEASIESMVDINA